MPSPSAASSGSTSDVIISDNDVLLRVGDPPASAPGPLADLLRELLDHRAPSAAPSTEADWLFPGRRPGQPMQHRSLGDALRRHNIPVQAGRTAALCQLVLQAPAPVVASMLGFHDKHTTRVLTEVESLRARRPRPVTYRLVPTRIQVTRLQELTSLRPRVVRGCPALTQSQLEGRSHESNLE